MKSGRIYKFSVYLNSLLMLTILVSPFYNIKKSIMYLQNKNQNVISGYNNFITSAFLQDNNPDFPLTYYNNILGFEIKYPTSLQLKNWDPEANILSSVSLFDRNCSYECEEISISVFSKQSGLSLKQWVYLHSYSDDVYSENNLEPPIFNHRTQQHDFLIYNQSAIIFSQEFQGMTIGRILIEYPEAVVSLLYSDLGSATFKSLFPAIISSFRANNKIIDYDTENTLYETIQQKINNFVTPFILSRSPITKIPQLPQDQGYKLPYTAGQSYQVTQGWGGTYSHTGLAYYAYDFGLPISTEVRASQSGTISVAIDTYTACGGQEYANYANRVVVNHSDGTATLYLHLKDVTVSQGAYVNRGDLIGHSGNVGWTNCTYHLHFQRQAQGGWWTQSQPIYFDEYPGQQLYYPNYYTSQNSNSYCSGPSLNSPDNDYVSSSQTISFSWTGPSGCTFQGYTFRVKDTSNMDSGGTTIYDEGQGGTSVTKTFDTQWNNKDLYWGVRTANPLSPNWSVRHFRIEPSQSCSPNSNQISLYVDTNFSGQCVTKDLGDYSNPSAIGLPNDSISSIRVGSNVQAILCRDDNFSGTCETFTNDDSNLGDNNIGDEQVSSARVQTRSTGYPVTLYVDPNYGGDWCALTGEGWANICDGYDNIASSVRLLPGWSARVWVDFNIEGASRCITSDIPDFSGLQYNENGNGSLNDSISSFAAYQQNNCPPLIPDTPSNFRVSSTTYNSITLAWDDVNHEDGYNIYKWGYQNGVWDFYYLSSVGANVTYFTDTSLQCGGADYYYEVSAYNSQGESSRTGWIQGLTAACPIPDTPSNFRVSGTTYNSITLAWDDVNYEEGYKIYKWGYQNGVWDFYYLSSVGANVTYFTDTSLQCGGIDYYYEVSAYNSQGESSRTGWIQGLTAACPTYTLTISKTGTGNGTVTSDPAGIDCGSTCSANFNYNTSVTLSASASAGSTFTGWSGSGCSGTGTCTVIMDSAKSVTATFTIYTYTLSVSKNGTGSGTVTSDPAGINCGATCSADFTENTTVILTATPIFPSVFGGWSGGGCSGIGTCIVLIDSDEEITAYFYVNLYKVYIPYVSR